MTRRWGANVRILVAIALLALAGAAAAQGLKPFAQERVTHEQYKQTFDQVSAAHGGTRKDENEVGLMFFVDKAARISYAFTQFGHPAHPAWIARQVVTEGGRVAIRQTGFYAGREEAFRELYRDFEQVNVKLQEDLQRQQDQQKGSQ